MARGDLAEYRKKRDPKRTPEPFGARHGGKAPLFVVQRHDARRLHYDFRLERDGVLASWAVPKGVPLEAGQRALAVHVEDHPLDYADFEGEIPKGQYGAGTVELWDRGTYELVEEKKDGGLTVRLEGKRLQGLWTLVPAKLDGDPQNWLLIKKRDSDATGSRGGAPPAIARDYRPTLATLAEEVPAGPDWLFEVKWDGYRAVAYVREGKARLISRNGNDLTERFTAIARAMPRATKLAIGSLRRRGVCTGRARPAELLGDATGEDEHPGGLRGVRRPRSRRRAAARSAAQGTASPAGGARRRTERNRAPVGGVRGRACSLRRRQGAGPRRNRRQARRLPLPAGQADPRVVEDQDPPPAGVRDRRLHERPGPTVGTLRLARPRRVARGRALLRRELRHGLHGQGDRRAARTASSPRAEGGRVRGRPEDAESAEGGRGLGEARVGLRGGVRRVDT